MLKTNSFSDAEVWCEMPRITGGSRQPWTSVNARIRPSATTGRPARRRRIREFSTAARRRLCAHLARQHTVVNYPKAAGEPRRRLQSASFVRQWNEVVGSLSETCT
jgi:hypothetical protein